MLDLTEIKAIDNHCHLPLKVPPFILSEAKLAVYFTEATDSEVLETQTPHSLFFRRALKDLDALLGWHQPETDFKSIEMLYRRVSVPPEAWFNQVVKGANLEIILADTGYPRSGALTVPEAQATLEKGNLGVKVFEIMRLERVLEDLLLELETYDQCEEAFRISIRQARSRGVVGLKSILAYRCGLRIQPENTSREKARAAFERLKAQSRETGTYVRIADKAFLDFLVPVALEEAAKEELPVQFHTGFGDTDVALEEVNPALLKPLFENPLYRKAPLVLLHCYPYMQEASYLASVYPQVFLDFSLCSPLVAFGGGSGLEDALGLAPTTKIMYGSDAWGVPDIIYLGSLHTRRRLAGVLDKLIREEWLSSREALEVARNLLSENARRVYQLG